MKLLFHAHFAGGGTETQREDALKRLGVEVVRSPLEERPLGIRRRVLAKVARRLGVDYDPGRENARLLALARTHRPDAVLVYNSRAIRAATLRSIAAETGAVRAYFDTDDAVAPHNVTAAVRSSFPEWDVFFTQKTFNMSELPDYGVRRPVLSGNIFDPHLHRPLTPEEVGEDYEKYDLVFVGTFEADREALLLALAQAGFSVLVHGNPAGAITGSWERLREGGVDTRPAATDIEYARAIHRGKVALGFLRKLHRDLITHRSIELPAMRRVMLAEKTTDHDAHFLDGTEYVGFTGTDDMILKARRLVANADLRERIGQAARQRCIDSGYDVDGAMARIVTVLKDARNARKHR